MGAALAARLLTQLQGFLTPLAGPLGIALCTLIMAFAAIRVAKFGGHWSGLVGAAVCCIIIMGAGAIASAAGGGGG